MDSLSASQSRGGDLGVLNAHFRERPSSAVGTPPGAPRQECGCRLVRTTGVTGVTGGFGGQAQSGRLRARQGAALGAPSLPLLKIPLGESPLWSNFRNQRQSLHVHVWIPGSLLV